MKDKAEEPICLPFREIKIIIGHMSTRSPSQAKETYLCEVRKVQISGLPPRMIREDEPAIVFTNGYARQLHHPHDDAIVIILSIANYMTRRVLMDNGSSTNIIYYPAF